MDWLKRSRELLGTLEGRITDEELSDWDAVMRHEGMIELFNSLCPPGVYGHLILEAEEIRDGGIHRQGCRPFLTPPGVRPRINGTMDAAADPDYLTIYERRG